MMGFNEMEIPFASQWQFQRSRMGDTGPFDRHLISERLFNVGRDILWDRLSVKSQFSSALILHFYPPCLQQVAPT
jgi:hypothetical protein